MEAWQLPDAEGVPGARQSGHRVVPLFLSVWSVMMIKSLSKFVGGFYYLMILTICWVGVSFVAGASIVNPIERPVFIPPIVEEKIEFVDEIALKQKEMRDTIVLVRTRRGTGSGTIIDRIDTDDEKESEYRVLTNAHVTYPRFFRYLREVDFITGKLNIDVVDTGCEIITFDYQSLSWNIYDAKIVEEDIEYDLAVLSFATKEELSVAKIADDDMLKQVRVFDEIFVVGCQLGRAPSPTFGIISQILTKNNGEQEWTIYCNTAQTTPGSSGGGLFKKYDDHYYLVGIPYRIAVTSDGQLVPHLSHAISISTARSFIEQNLITYP